MVRKTNNERKSRRSIEEEWKGVKEIFLDELKKNVPKLKRVSRKTMDNNRNS